MKIILKKNRHFVKVWHQYRVTRMNNFFVVDDKIAIKKFSSSEMVSVC